VFWSRPVRTLSITPSRRVLTTDTRPASVSPMIGPETAPFTWRKL